MGVRQRKLYTHRPAPAQYDVGWMATEFGNVERAIPALAVLPLTAAYTAQTSDDFLPCDATSAGFTVTLPAATSVWRLTVLKTDVSAHAVTISGTVSGVVNPTLGAQYASLTMRSDGGGVIYKVAST